MCTITFLAFVYFDLLNFLCEYCTVPTLGWNPSVVLCPSFKRLGLCSEHPKGLYHCEACWHHCDSCWHHCESCWQSIHPPLHHPHHHHSHTNHHTLIAVFIAPQQTEWVRKRHVQSLILGCCFVEWTGQKRCANAVLFVGCSLHPNRQNEGEPLCPELDIGLLFLWMDWSAVDK